MKNARLNKKRMEGLRKALYEATKEMNVKIYEGNPLFSEDGETVTFEANWSAIGNVNAQQTRKMANDLAKVADIVEFLNEMQIEYTYEEDEELESLLREGNVELARARMQECAELFSFVIKIEEKSFFDTFREA